MSNLKLFKRTFKSSKLSPKSPPVKQNYLSDCHRTYSCIHCRAHLANHDELISKLFQGNHGRAYLFNKVVNTGCRKAVQRELLTGLHAVADIYCDNCKTTLGWKYEQAFAPSQKYKEGKYIIEVVHMLKENDWDLTSYNARDILDEVESLSQKQSESSNFYIGNRLQWLSETGCSINRNEELKNTTKRYVNELAQEEQESTSNAGSASPVQESHNLAFPLGSKPIVVQSAADQEAVDSNRDLNMLNKVDITTDGS